MDEHELRLDGNAAAGLLQEVFGFEATLMPRTCATCHGTAPLGAHHVYAHGPGTVMRCPTCQDLALRIVHAPDRIYVEVRGVLELEPTL
jgi:hypothetical protein